MFFVVVNVNHLSNLQKVSQKHLKRMEINIQPRRGYLRERERDKEREMREAAP